MARRGSYRWESVPGVDDQVLCCGEVDGLPAVRWGWADRSALATRRQLRALGLRPGGEWPVAVLVFRRRGREVRALLYAVARALPKREATPAQLAAIGRALVARRTCRECHAVQERCVSTLSRMCAACEDRTDFWRSWAAERGIEWPADDRQSA